MSERAAPGRRIAERAVDARRRLNPLLIVGIAAVVISLAAVSGLKASDESVADPAREALFRPLASQTMSCPAPAARGSMLIVGSFSEPGEGAATTRDSDGGSSASLTLVPGDVTKVSKADRSVVVSASGAAAPGLVGARVRDSAQPAFAECVMPAAEVWFNGAGAGGLHESKLSLVNPDQGPAVADVTLWTTTGEIDAPMMRGLAVPGGASTEIDLSEVSPTREEITVRVSVTRGRLASSMVDRYTPRGGSVRTDGLPSSQAPTKDLLIPGFPRKSAEAVLVLTNPGEDAARVQLSVVGAKAEFNPAGFEEIRVPAGQVVVIDLPSEVTKLVASEDASLRLTASVPVTAGVRAVIEGDFAHLPTAVPVHGDAATLVPVSGSRTLVLGTPATAAAVNVEFIGATKSAERKLATRVRPKTSTAVKVPAGTRAVVVRSSGAVVGAVRTTSSRGISLAPLRPLVTEKIVPDVRPEW